MSYIDSVENITFFGDVGIFIFAMRTAARQKEV
jgi:hypothetical protein